jgi:hypothetical protein
MRCRILEEVRRVKRERAARCGYDIERMGEEARKFAEERGAELVSRSRTGEVTVVVKGTRKQDPAILAEIEELHRQWDIEAEQRGIDLGPAEAVSRASRRDGRRCSRLLQKPLPK